MGLSSDYIGIIVGAIVSVIVLIITVGLNIFVYLRNRRSTFITQFTGDCDALAGDVGHKIAEFTKLGGARARYARGLESRRATAATEFQNSIYSGQNDQEARLQALQRYFRELTYIRQAIEHWTVNTARLEQQARDRQPLVVLQDAEAPVEVQQYANPPAAQEPQRRQNEERADSLIELQDFHSARSQQTGGSDE